MWVLRPRSGGVPVAGIADPGGAGGGRGLPEGRDWCGGVVPAAWLPGTGPGVVRGWAAMGW